MPPLNDSSPEESAAARAKGGAFPAGGGLMKGVDDASPDKSAEQVRAKAAPQAGVLSGPGCIRQGGGGTIGSSPSTQEFSRARAAPGRAAAAP